MNETPSRATAFGAIGGVVAALVVAVVSTWLAAEANRTEALRQERRRAYVKFIGAVTTCESSSTFDRFGRKIPDLPKADQLVGLSKAQLGVLLSDLFGQMEQVDRRGLRYRNCTIPLRNAEAAVAILTSDQQVRNAASDLAIEAIKYYDADQTGRNTLKPYVSALTEFELLAADDANAPLISPLLIQAAGLTLFLIVLAGTWVLALGRYLRARALSRSPSVRVPAAKVDERHESTTEDGDDNLKGRITPT